MLTFGTYRILMATDLIDRDELQIEEDWHVEISSGWHHQEVRKADHDVLRTILVHFGWGTQQRNSRHETANERESSMAPNAM